MSIPPHLSLEIVTPERVIAHERVDEVQIPGAEGYFGVLPGHTPLLSTLTVGHLWYRKGQERTSFFVAFGFAEVQPDRVTILAEVAERPEEIDVSRAELAKQRAEMRLTQPPGEGGAREAIDVERARIALLKSLIRLQMASRGKLRA